VTVFISYRRSDTQQAAGRLADRLIERFGPDAVVIDVTTDQIGRDYRSVIFDSIENADVVLALVGPRFLVESPDGSRRLDDPDDPLRMELSRALARRGVPVIPVLVDGAELPARESLPEDVQALTFRGALELAHQRFDRDYEYLETQVARYLEPSAPAIAADGASAHRIGADAAASPPSPPRAAPEQRIATSTESGAGTPAPKVPTRRTPTTRRSRGRQWIWIALTAATMIVGVGVVAAIGLLSGGSDDPQDRGTLSLPTRDEIYEQPPDVVVARLEAIGLDVATKSSGCSESTPAGLVRQLTLGTELNQRIIYGKSTDAIDEQAATELRPGDLVTVWVSSGPC
jgi:hypothetical protein